jgi:hypothetical protein
MAAAVRVIAAATSSRVHPEKEVAVHLNGQTATSFFTRSGEVAVKKVARSGEVAGIHRG